MKQAFQKIFEVHSYDLSFNGQLNPVKMIDYFSDTAGSHSESSGYPLETLFKKGYAWVLLSWNIGFEHLPRLSEKILIETWISHIKRCFAYREFFIRNNLNQILVRASSQWIFYHIHKKRPVKISSELSKNWIIYPEKANPLFIITSSLPKQPVYQDITKTVSIQQQDIDILDHVHNSKYIDWIIEMKPESIQHHSQLRHLQILYNHEVKYPGEIIIRQQLMSPKNDEKQLFYDIIWDQNKQRISAEIVTQWEYAH